MNAVETSTRRLPADHSLRLDLNDEVHARPIQPIATPARISYMVLLSPADERARQWTHFSQLLEQHGHAPPASPASCYSADLPRFSVRYERHTEFSRYTITAAQVGADYFASTALEEVPRQWLEGLTGSILVAAHGVIVAGGADSLRCEDISERYFRGNALIGSVVGDHSAAAFTDFRILPDGFSRFVVIDFKLTPREAGRTVQRVLEIDTYRMLALLALPVAQQLAPVLTEYERELSRVIHVLQTADTDDEASLLDRLTHLEAQIESEEAKSLFRFAAADAYHALVKRRIVELREQRLPGLQPFEEFTERRLAPAMNTCSAAAARQRVVSENIARANELLATRVTLTQQRQNHLLFESMNRRSKAQLELQQAVESLSLAAITYYVVALIGYAARGLHALGWNVNYEIVTAVSILPVAALLLLGLRAMHRANRERAPKTAPTDG